MIEIQCPNDYSHVTGPTVFMGGSIEMNKARNWQQELCREFERVDVTFLNPRRDDWDNKIVQSIDDPRFYEQVSWELKALGDADIIAFYFDPDTKSPVTLLELGAMVAQKKNCIVCCPEGYWRKGNVDIYCEMHGVRVLSEFSELTEILRLELRILNTNA